MQKSNFPLKLQLKITKLQKSDYKIKYSKFIIFYKKFLQHITQHGMNSLLLFKQPFCLDAYITTVCSLCTTSLQTGL